MPLSPELLNIIVCPVTRQRLEVATEKKKKQVLDLIRRDTITLDDHADWDVAEVTDLLITVDGAIAYPVISDIPNLLPNAGIRLDG